MSDPRFLLGLGQRPEPPELEPEPPARLPPLKFRGRPGDPVDPEPAAPEPPAEELPHGGYRSLLRRPPPLEGAPKRSK